MNRREFITLLGGAAAAWPLAARAQQHDRVRRIGVLLPYHDRDPEGLANLAAFRKSLQELGWAEGRKFGSIIAGPQATASGLALTRRSSPGWRRTSSSASALRSCRRCSTRF